MKKYIYKALYLFPILQYCNFLYWIIFSFYKCALLFTPAKVWMRNSVPLGYAVFPLSDIDLSISIEKSRIKRLRAILKIFMPFRYGENAVYINESLNFYSSYLNSYEAEREPGLNKLFLKEKTNHEGVVFLLKMLWSDKNNLQLHPRFRVEKWRYHFQQYDFLYNKKRPLSENILALIEHVISHRAFSHHVYEAVFLEKEEIKIYHLLLNSELLWGEWRKQTPEIVFIFSCLDDYQRDLLKELLRWEIWGIYSQLALREESNNMKNHLKTLIHLNNQVTHDLDINKGLEALLLDLGL